MKAQHLLIAAALSACSSSVFAQWQWIDESGRKVFSDRPPPAHIAPQKILKQPAHTPARNTPAPTSAGPAAAPEPGDDVAEAKQPDEAASGAGTPVPPSPSQAARTAAVDKELQATKAKQEAEAKAKEEAKRQAEAAQRRKEEALAAKARQENCLRARTTQSTIESGVRLSQINEKGERGFMNEEQRNAELKNAKAAIQRDC